MHCLRIDIDHSLEAEQQPDNSFLSVVPSVLDEDSPKLSLNQCSNQALAIKGTHSHGSDELTDTNQRYPGAIH